MRTRISFPGNSQQKGNSPAAFTLVEMLAVLMLVALLATLAIVRLMPGASQNEAESAIRQLQAIREIATRSARQQQSPLVCEFDTRAAECALTTPDGSRTLRRWRNVFARVGPSRAIHVGADGEMEDIVVVLPGNDGRFRYGALIGCSGEFVEVVDESSLDDIFRMLRSPPRIHTP